MSLRLDRAALAVLLLPLIASAPPGPVGKRCAAVQHRTLAARSAADAAGRRRDVRAENARLDEALAALGSTYATPAMIDDTGMRLVLARAATRDGRLAQAAGLKRRVLAERLHLCAAG